MFFHVRDTVGLRICDARIVTEMAKVEEMDPSLNIWGNKIAVERKGLSYLVLTDTWKSQSCGC